MTKKIVVVDDDPMIRMLVTDCLTALGHTVEPLEDATSCLARLNPGENLPDILVLELIMPDMNGLEVLKLLRENPKTSAMHVIMLTANSDTEQVANSMNIKANYYLAKPFNMKTLMDALASTTPNPD